MGSRDDRPIVVGVDVSLLDEETRAVVTLHPGPAVADELVHDTALPALLARGKGARMLVVGHRGRPSGRALVEFAVCPVVVTPPVPAAASAGSEPRAAEPAP